MGEAKRFSPLYVFAALYVAGVYAFVPLLLALNKTASQAHSQAEYDAQSVSFPLLIPVILGVINLIAVIALRHQTTREQLLNCALFIKYALIPFYIMGGLCIACALLLMFTPVVIMMFVGPAVAVIFSVAGWVILVCGAPFSIGYLVKAKNEGIHPRALCKIAGILQLFFAADVLSMMVLAFKERKWIKTTVILLLILLAGITGVMIWAGVKIAGAVL